jgi:hypothetical protein
MSLPRQYRHMQDEITIRRACSLMSPHDVDTALVRTLARVFAAALLPEKLTIGQRRCMQAAACVARICGKDGGEVIDCTPELAKELAQGCWQCIHGSGQWIVSSCDETSDTVLCAWCTSFHPIVKY